MELCSITDAVTHILKYYCNRAILKTDVSLADKVTDVIPPKNCKHSQFNIIKALKMKP